MLDAVSLSEAQIANLQAAIDEGDELLRRAASSIIRALSAETPSGFEDVRRRINLYGEIERDVRELRRVLNLGHVIVPGGQKAGAE